MDVGSRNKTYVYLWTCRQFEQEQVEWDDVNKLLQHHGFKPVHFADPVENKKLSDLVLLDKKSAGEIRATLRTMLIDSERTKALIQELVKSNNQHKEEVQEHMRRAVHQSQRVTDLEGLMDEVKARVQDMENRYLSITIQHHSHTQQLLQEKQEAQKRSEDLEQELSRQREKMPQLQRKLHLILKEEHGLVKEDKNTTGIRESTWKASESSLCAHYCQLLTEISAVVTNLSAPLQLHRQKPASVDLELAEFHNLLPTLEFWAQQLHLMKELYQGLTNLITRLLPQLLPDGGHDSAEAVKVEDMILLVDTLLESTSLKDKVLKSPTRITLLSMVSHFQKLFGMTSLSGVYPRMNEVYTSLGKMTNTMRTLQDILDLDSRVSPAEVVNQVARLVHLNELNASFCNLVEDADIQRIFVKVKQHEEFFPAFHAVISEMLQVLDCVFGDLD
ncbi:centrosomal protein of 70 kDa isoform X2 [Solea solea]|uniref:centrosomal protein of 70 kDa isoform X2 n=1 Tax=Solea solea TaxID=90069 RepID=UPI00272CB64A|nr:centrosomal protein of 70 kDa isoform X2 [Solea solea]